LENVVFEVTNFTTETGTCIDLCKTAFKTVGGSVHAEKKSFANYPYLINIYFCGIDVYDIEKRDQKNVKGVRVIVLNNISVILWR
jgi:hypothetical protein